MLSPCRRKRRAALAQNFFLSLTTSSLLLTLLFVASRLLPSGPQKRGRIIDAGIRRIAVGLPSLSPPTFNSDG